MNLTAYQPLARRTMKELPYREHIEHMSVGVIGEVGEFADALKKHVIYGKPLDIINLSEEGGDCWWYVVGLLPELNVGEATLQAGFDEGVADVFGYKGSAIQLVVQAMAQISSACLRLIEHGAEMPPADVSATVVGIIGRNMGRLYGYFGLDLPSSLETNIAKLAKRYGEKYSDYSALNRDTSAERDILEAGLAQPLGDIIGAPLSDENLDTGTKTVPSGTKKK